MSKLENLIAEHCPNGVEYKEVREICTIYKGIQFNKSNMQKHGTYPVINGGINPSGYIEQYNCDENTITIAQGGAAGYVNFIETKFWAGAHCYTIKPKKEINNRFLYHFLKANETKLQELKYGTTILSLSKNSIETLLIPFPPLSVQCEIVRILDNFTELTKQLTQELTARKKQYEYYRDSLLSFKKSEGGVILKQVGEICTVQRGDQCNKSNMQKHRTYPVINGGINPSGYIEQYNCDENTITVANGGASAGYVNFISTKFWLGADCFSIKPKSEIHNKYLFHFLKSNEFKLKNYQYGAAIPHLQRNTITSLEIPIPPIKIQERIVKILDNFEKICNDLKIGLPAEIEARQKQYEFYRDKLLSFKQT